MAGPIKGPEEALQKVMDQLECSICLDEYKDPKVLSCFHVFCKQCLEPLVLHEHEQSILHCPNCRHPTVLTPQGVEGLQSDFRMHHLFEIRDTLAKAKEHEQTQTQCEKCKKSMATNFCRDCGKFVCDKCTELHQLWDEFTNHQIVTISDLQSQAASLIPPRKKIMPCQQHPENPLKIYCDTCNELICNDCTIKLHQGHQYDLISATFTRHKQEIVDQLEPVKQHLTTVNQALHSFDARSKEIQEQTAAIQTDIHKEIDQLHQALEQRRTELIGQLDHLTQHKLKRLAAQRDQVELMRTQLSSCLEYVEGSLKTGSPGEILEMKVPVLEQVQQITAEVKPATLTPKEKANVFLVAGNIPDLNQACREVAEVVKKYAACANNSYISTEEMGTMTVGQTTTLTLYAIDKDENECQKKIAKISSELVSCTDASTVKCEVKRSRDNQYQIQYQPDTRGKHQLHVRINGKSIKGSPYTVVARLSLQSLEKPVRTIGKLKKPWGITTDSKGRIIIAEFGSNCISILTQQGHKIRSFGSKGKERGQFNEPRGVVVDRDDNIYVTDDENCRIQKFTSEGEFITLAGSRGSEPLQFHYPCGIALNSKNGKLYVCDHYNHRIQILNTDLTLSSSFGSKGSKHGQFNCPLDVAFDTSGNVYIVDYKNHRIQAFTLEGKFLRQFGSKGSGDGQLGGPVSIAIDNCDTVYITEHNNHRVSIFTTQGHFLKTLGACGHEEGKFYRPSTIRIDKYGFILINDFANNRLQIFCLDTSV